MNKKRWALLILALLLLTSWYKLFSKTWNNQGVPKNADCIITLDVKRITNTLIWNYITTPSQWKSSNWFSSSEEGKVSWDDMICLPDYVFIFHRAGEPANAFYTLVEINDKDDFVKGLTQFGFEKTDAGGYISKQTGLSLIQNGNRLLIGNAAVEDKHYLKQAAADLFNQKLFIDKASLAKSVSAKSHFALNGQLFNNSTFNNSYNIRGNFTDTALVFSMPFNNDNEITSHSFSYCDTAMLSFGFTQPSIQFKKYVPLQQLSKAVNFNIDSLLLPANRSYQLDITGIYPRTDSAITYTYDDNFNPVENVIVNIVEEPAFVFTVSGDSVKGIYDYWNRNGLLENTGGSSWFTPVPFAKSYCSIKNKNTLTITSAGYTEPLKNTTIESSMFLKILLSKVPTHLYSYLSPSAKKLLKNIETMEAGVSKETGQTVLKLQFNKKKNDLPLVEF